VKNANSSITLKPSIIHLMYFKPPVYLLLILPVIFIASCVSQKKVIAKWQELRNKEAQLTASEKKLDSLSSSISQKAQRNEIDDTTAARIQRFIGISKKEIDKIQAQNEILAGKTMVDKEDWLAIRQNLELANETLRSTTGKLEMIADLLSRSLVIKIDEDIIFEPGQYKVSSALVQNISKIFEPAANEIESFVKKYPDYDLSLIVNANGFADGTSIAEGSALYKDIKSKIKNQNASGKELNKELSRLRAEEVIGLFKNYFYSRPKVGKNISNTLYTFEGRGDELPNPKINDYKIDDARRRVVLLYWSVFPD
jgi:flagellar motor protein MotB